ncbi:MAG: heparinase [Planctomycetota bacterium]|nr:MAG: heparinase [Planctomycetota bacterium]
MRIFAVLAVLASTAAAGDIPKPNPRIAGGAWAKTLQTHPKLLGPVDHLKALSKAKPELWKELESNGKDGRSLLETGLVYAATGGSNAQEAQKYVAVALALAKRGVTNAHQDTWIALATGALTYDLFHDKFTEEQRKEMLDWFNGHLGKFTEDEIAFHNSTMSKTRALLLVAWGTSPENPKAKEWKDWALTKLYEGRLLPVIHEFGAGGGFTEAGAYLRGCLWSLVESLELARRFENYDGFAKAPEFWYHRISYEMLNAMPGTWTYGAEQYSMEGDGGQTYGGQIEHPRHSRRVLAQYWRGSDLARILATYGQIHTRGSNAEARLVDFLWDEGPEPQPLPLENFKLSHFASGIGKVFARSDWTADATWMRFEVSDYWCVHQHMDAGNFEIFRSEPLATESGVYDDFSSDHSVNYYIRTIAHNCVLVEQPGEEGWKKLRDVARYKYVNDGGQAQKWDWTKGLLDDWKRERDEYERGNVVAYDASRPEFLYTAGDCTAAYAASKLKLWVRQIVFLRPHTLVICDRVVATRADYGKAWLLHVKDEPDIGEAKEKSPGELEGSGDRFKSVNGKGELHGQVLLPEKRRLRKVGGRGVKDYWVDGRNVTPGETVSADVTARWRIELRPGEPREEDVFLVVLSTDGAPRASLAKRGAKTTVKLPGAEVTFDLDRRCGGEVRVGAQKFPLNEEIKKGKWE